MTERQRIRFEVDSSSPINYEQLMETLKTKSEPKPKKPSSKKIIGVADRAFYHTVRDHIPSAKLIDNYTEVSAYDLVIFTGGEDINPGLYGEDNTYSHGVNNNRDTSERRIFNEAFGRKKQIVGFCRGHQLINALLGGSLYQDYVIQNPGFKYHPGNHNLVDTKGIIDRFFGNKEIISCHHQAVRNLGDGLFPTSFFGGIIESLEHTSGRIITTQFHPEFDYPTDVADFFKFIVEEW